MFNILDALAKDSDLLALASNTNANQSKKGNKQKSDRTELEAVSANDGNKPSSDEPNQKSKLVSSLEVSSDESGVLCCAVDIETNADLSTFLKTLYAHPIQLEQGSALQDAFLRSVTYYVYPLHQSIALNERQSHWDSLASLRLSDFWHLPTDDCALYIESIRRTKMQWFKAISCLLNRLLQASGSNSSYDFYVLPHSSSDLSTADTKLKSGREALSTVSTNAFAAAERDFSNGKPQGPMISAMFYRHFKADNSNANTSNCSSDAYCIATGLGKRFLQRLSELGCCSPYYQLRSEQLDSVEALQSLRSRVSQSNATRIRQQQQLSDSALSCALFVGDFQLRCFVHVLSESLFQCHKDDGVDISDGIGLDSNRKAGSSRGVRRRQLSRESELVPYLLCATEFSFSLPKRIQSQLLHTNISNNSNSIDANKETDKQLVTKSIRLRGCFSTRSMHLLMSALIDECKSCIGSNQNQQLTSRKREIPSEFVISKQSLKASKLNSSAKRSGGNNTSSSSGSSSGSSGAKAVALLNQLADLKAPMTIVASKPKPFLAPLSASASSIASSVSKSVFTSNSQSAALLSRLSRHRQQQQQQQQQQQLSASLEVHINTLPTVEYSQLHSIDVPNNITSGIELAEADGKLFKQQQQLPQTLSDWQSSLQGNDSAAVLSLSQAGSSTPIPHQQQPLTAQETFVSVKCVPYENLLWCAYSRSAIEGIRHISSSNVPLDDRNEWEGDELEAESQVLPMPEVLEALAWRESYSFNSSSASRDVSSAADANATNPNKYVVFTRSLPAVVLARQVESSSVRRKDKADINEELVTNFDE